jgi:hypothetical protein
MDPTQITLLAISGTLISAATYVIIKINCCKKTQEQPVVPGEYIISDWPLVPARHQWTAAGQDVISRADAPH